MKKYFLLTILLTFIAFSVIAHFHNEAWEEEREISGGTVISGIYRTAGDVDGPLNVSSYCIIYKTWSDTMPSDTHDGMVHHWYAAGSVYNSEDDEKYEGDWFINVQAIGHETLFAKNPSGPFEGQFSKSAAVSLAIENFGLCKEMFPDVSYDINKPYSVSRMLGNHPSKQEDNAALTTIPF
ncbi:hypothetical protein J4G08_01190 [Candidatus Poribacteria bacterium]|nr:hypothetical protein [Candidatus Poribacteria bacterium]